jgi:ADP-heptose:LPS heptosyltransferase
LKNKRYIIRYDGLGDALWAEPVIAHFARNTGLVIVITHHPTLFENYPFVNVQFQYRLTKFEKVLQFLDKHFLGAKTFINLNGAYEQKPKQHVLLSYQQKSKINFLLQYPQIYLSTIEKQKKWFDEKYVILHLENSLGKNYRNIYGIDWKIVTKHLVALNYKVIQVGKLDQKIENSYYLRTQSIRDLITLINSASMFIGADSGPSHIAASLKIPSLLFFGSVNPDFRHLLDKFKGLILQQNCLYAGCYHDVISTEGQVCRIVGDEGIPPCALHTNEYLIAKIEILISMYNL